VSAATPGSFRLGFDKELIALFPDKALRGELVESVPGSSEHSGG